MVAWFVLASTGWRDERLCQLNERFKVSPCLSSACKIKLACVVVAQVLLLFGNPMGSNVCSFKSQEPCRFGFSKVVMLSVAHVGH